MAQTSHPAIGDRIAFYRRMNRQSAEELATAAGAGLTRSVITNLENRRKEDVTVRQLFALAHALGVPPVALMVDLHSPDEKLALRGDLDRDGRRWSMRNGHVIDWIAGEVRGRSDRMTAAGVEAYFVLEHLRDYKRTAWQYMELLKIRDAAEMADPGGERPLLLDKQIKSVEESVNMHRRALQARHIDLGSLTEPVNVRGLWQLAQVEGAADDPEDSAERRDG